MRKSEVYIKQYPHGFNDGFWYVNGKCPPPHYFVVVAQQLRGEFRV